MGPIFTYVGVETTSTYKKFWNPCRRRLQLAAIVATYSFGQLRLSKLHPEKVGFFGHIQAQTVITGV